MPSPSPADLFVFLVSAALLSIERLTYVFAWHRPEGFERLARTLLPERFGDPVAALALCCSAFKGIQAAVFIGWVLWFGGRDFVSDLLAGGPWILALGFGLAAAGQLLNLGVFWRLGRDGVFYGQRFGHKLPWVVGFPFSVTAHPQYLGVVLTVWGFFLLTRFPNPDWWVLPVLETVYYALGSRFEREFEERLPEPLMAELEAAEDVVPEASRVDAA